MLDKRESGKIGEIKVVLMRVMVFLIVVDLQGLQGVIPVLQNDFRQ